jgi:hypothetical protein
MAEGNQCTYDAAKSVEERVGHADGITALKANLDNAINKIAFK